MISKQGEKALFSSWKVLGPSVRASRYFSEYFDTWEEYYNLVAKFYGISNGWYGLKRHIIDEANEYLSNPSNLSCPEYSIELYDIDLESSKNSLHIMKIYQTKGFGTKPSANFIIDDMREDYVCTDEEERYYSDYECFQYECIYPPISKVTSMIKDKYGFGVNVNTYDESNSHKIK